MRNVRMFCFMGWNVGVITDYLPTFLKNVNFINKCEDGWLSVRPGPILSVWEHLWRRWWKICLETSRIVIIIVSYRWIELRHFQVKTEKYLCLIWILFTHVIALGLTFECDIILEKLGKLSELLNTSSCCTLYRAWITSIVFHHTM